MTKKREFADSTLYMNLLKNNVSPIDLFILSAINAGVKHTDLIKLLEKGFSVAEPKKEIVDRLKKMYSDKDPEKRVILDDIPKFLVDPAKLYDRIFIVLMKANLASFEGRLIDASIQEIYTGILELNNHFKYEKPLSQLYPLIGWDYDFLGIVFENDLNRFLRLKEELLRNGLIASFVPILVDSSNGIHYDPNPIPDFEQYQRFLVNYRDRINGMIKDLREKDIQKAKTEKFFEKGDYGLELISGIDAGTVYYLDKAEVKIGRFYDNDITINRDQAVSRRHARILVSDNKFIFEDDSLNGTLVNNKKINHDELELKVGDEIVIGRTKFIFKPLWKNAKK